MALVSPFRRTSLSATNAYAELEIGLHRAYAAEYQVELRFSDPASAAEVPPERGAAVLDLGRLLTLWNDPDTYGGVLADGLFHDDNVRGLYIRAHTATAAKDRFLRLRLLVGPSAQDLHALRWELLHDLETGAPLATSERTLFSRFLMSRDYRPVTLRPQADLKALVAVAAPRGLAKYQLADVDADGEVRRATAALAGIDPDVAGRREPLTLERLVDALRGGVDVLYLVCHGVLTSGQVPYLFLQDDGGGVARVEGEKLARAVAGLRQPPRLVVLASCEGAGTEQGTTAAGRATAEAALAPRLAEAGVPAVVAMQGRVSMETVARAMPVFFRELLADGQIDRALAVARAAVRDRSDAWMPALYSRLKRGAIWQQENGDGEDDVVPEQSAAVLSPRTWPPPDFPEQPYPVLLPYTRPDLLAGRGREIEKLRTDLRLPVPILGLGAPSGTGKSSLLLGGLVPVLRAEGVPVAVVRHPREAGVAGLLLGDLLDGVGDVGDDDWRGFVEHLERLASTAEPPLLVLDQFEDVLRPEAAPARARLGVLLAATTRRRPGTDEPLCRWLLAYRIEAHGELLAWLEDVLLDTRDANAGGGIEALPYDLSGPDRFLGRTLAPLATPSSADDAPAESARVFQAAIEKPLALRTPEDEPRYPWRFAPGHAERLARAFADARLARPSAPLVPELQVVLAHLLAEADPDGLLTVPDDPGELVGEALADHLRRALEAAFPAGTAGAALLRARALLALRELATAGGERDEGVLAEELARAVGDDGERILEKLATPLTRLVVLQDSPAGLCYVLSHDRMAEVVVRMVEDEGRQGKLLVDADLLALRGFVALKTALHSAQGASRVATRISRRHYQGITAHAGVLLRDDERRAWWAACQKRRRDDRRRSTGFAAAVLAFLVLGTWGIWSWVGRIREHEALFERIFEGEPGAALEALDRLADDSDVSPEELLGQLRRRPVAMDVLELGLGDVSEDDRSAFVLRTVEIALPWVAETPEDPVLIANLVWALDYAPARDPPSAARARALRERVLGPLRERRPPPAIPAEDPDWVPVPAGTFLMGSPEGEGDNDEARHEVTVSAFRILRHEVTNAEYRRLFPGHGGQDDLPAARVTWYAAYTYAAWLGGRLPTEAEWEYAAHAGCPYAYCTRDGEEATVDDVAWTLRNSRQGGELAASPVMALEPNPWGLYDMPGNLWEWTTDWYDWYPAEAVDDPWGPVATSGGRRVTRGGSFGDLADWARVAYRSRNAPGVESEDLGFRAVLPGRPEP